MLWRKTARWVAKQASLPLGAGVCAALAVVVLFRKFESKAIIQPATEVAPQGGLLGLAAQVGFGALGAGSSSAFLAQLMTTQTTLLEAFAPCDTTTSSQLPTSRNPSSSWRRDDTWILLELGTDSPVSDCEALRRAVLVHVPRMIKTASSSQTNTVEVIFRHADARVAQNALGRLLSVAQEQLQRLADSVSASAAVAASRQYGAIRDSLANAEEDLRRFALANRTIAGSPNLQLEFERRSRTVRLFEEMAITLHREMSSARARIASGATTFLIVEPPTFPYERTRPSLVLVFATGTIVSLFLQLARRWLPRLLVEAGL